MHDALAEAPVALLQEGMADMRYIAGYKFGALSDSAKYHACNPSTAVRDNHIGTRLTARCGAKWLSVAKGRQGPREFDSILHLEQCQRCVKLLEEGAQ